MVGELGYNDGIVLASLLFSCVDLHLEWASFSTCSQPIHWWLLVSYACVICFRATHLLGSRAAAPAATDEQHSASHGSDAGIGEFLLDLRHKGSVPRALVAFTWAVALPFFTLWTLIGTKWLWGVLNESPQCVPTSTHLWFSGFWLALCYIWIAVHVALCGVAWTLERRIQRAESDLRSIEDEDVLRRWGHVSHMSDYRAVNGLQGPETTMVPSWFDTGRTPTMTGSHFGPRIRLRRARVLHLHHGIGAR